MAQSYLGSSQSRPWSPEIGGDRQAIEDDEDDFEDVGPIPLGTSDFPMDDEGDAGTLRDPVDEETIVDTDEYSQRNITYSTYLIGSLSHRC
jgi:hypothetical protein